MAVSNKPPSNAFVATMRKVYNPIGYSKGYNFVLWFVFAGAMLGFCLARFQLLNFDSNFCPPKGGSGTAPGECWTYKQHPHYVIGIKLHLFTILPAGFLACFQFVPVIRHKLLLVHRLNGYIVLALSLIGTVGALMIARAAFGGGQEIQGIVGLLAILFLGSLAISFYNVKRLQLEQHRAWMLRAWFYAGCIITTRFIQILAAKITSMDSIEPTYKAMPCLQILDMFKNNSTKLELLYPVCTNTSAWAAVHATMNGKSVANIAASMESVFGLALWLALAIHAIGIEIYLQLTPAEAERLRNVSYQRQLEAGFKQPGRSGLTADRIGDAIEWQPEENKKTAPKTDHTAPTAETL